MTIPSADVCLMTWSKGCSIAYHILVMKFKAEFSTHVFINTWAENSALNCSFCIYKYSWSNYNYILSISRHDFSDSLDKGMLPTSYINNNRYTFNICNDHIICANNNIIMWSLALSSFVSFYQYRTSWCLLVPNWNIFQPIMHASINGSRISGATEPQCQISGL